MKIATKMESVETYETFGRSAFDGFPLAVRVGNTLYMGGQCSVSKQSASENADVGTQTHGVFTQMVTTLKAAGLTMNDLVKLHTYYVFDGEGRDVTTYWEKMTAVRLEYLAKLGPAATALRVLGAPTGKELITIDGIASYESDRQRIMPVHAWDWSIPTPFSQGWRVANHVYVGGQISADRQGKAIAPGNALEQTKNTLEYIKHVLLDAGADWKDVVSLKIAYRHDGRSDEAKQLLDTILGCVREVLPSPGPALTCIGVDLLYEGLLLEIDAVAVIAKAQEKITADGSQTWIAIPGFAPSIKSGDEIYIGGTCAPGAASLEAQAEASMERVGRTLNAAGAQFSDLVKLNVFYTDDQYNQKDASSLIARIVGEYITTSRPALSIIKLPGLPHDGQRIQIDAIAVMNTTN